MAIYMELSKCRGSPRCFFFVCLHLISNVIVCYHSLKEVDNMTKKKPTMIRIGNLERTLRMIESMTEEIANEDGKAGADLVIRLIRKEYGIEEETEK